MDELGELLRVGMRRRHVTPQMLADRTGIRTPRIRAFTEDGAGGPVRPTEEELVELADALSLPRLDVLGSVHLRAPGG